jgi:hypothetical protein
MSCTPVDGSNGESRRCRSCDARDAWREGSAVAHGERVQCLECYRARRESRPEATESAGDTPAGGVSIGELFARNGWRLNARALSHRRAMLNHLERMAARLERARAGVTCSVVPFRSWSPAHR